MASTLLPGRQIQDATVVLSKLGPDIIDGAGKLLASLLPAGVAGAMVYKGAFNAAALAEPAMAAPDNLGHYYVVTVDGSGYNVGDAVVSNGVTWDRIDNTERVYTRETPAGLLNGTNLVFTLAKIPFIGTLAVFLNGQLQEPVDDYNLMDATLSMVVAPLASDKIRAIYYV